MIASTRRGLVALIAALAVMSVLAGTASAGTIRYAVAPSPNYTVQDNGNGIVKVFYSACLESAGRYTINFQTTVQVTNKEATATWRVLKEEGEEPGSTFTQPSVFLPKGKDTTFDVSWSFNAPTPTNGVTMFRAKLDPESGEGLGEGAGIMVRVDCVVAPGEPGPVITPDPIVVESPAPASTTTLPALTQGLFPGVNSVQAKGAAPCISTPKRKALTAGDSFILRVIASNGDTPIAGAKVRVYGAGIRKIATTNSRGEARFRIKAKRSGTLVIQSDACFGADRLDVLAKRAERRVAPRFAG